MENNSVNAVETLSPSALTPELIGQIERDALSETALLAPRCGKILRMLREGAGRAGGRRHGGTPGIVHLV